MAWRSNETRDNLLKLLGYKIEDSKLVHTDTENIFILADVETSGLDFVKDRIIQISALKCKYNSTIKSLEIIDEMDEYIKPEITVINKDGSTSIVNEISEKITELTGITNDLLSTKPFEKEVFPKISSFFGSSPIFIAYNSNFDKTFITNMFIRNKEPFKIENDKELDALKMARDLVSKEDAPKITDSTGKEKPTYKLGHIAQLYGVDTVSGYNAESFHSSIFDTKVMRNLVDVFISEYLEKIEEELNKPEVEKHRAKVESLGYWAGYRGYSRIYVNAILDGEKVSYYFDIRNKNWGSKYEGAIEKTLMDEMKADALALACCVDEMEFARIKEPITATPEFLERYSA